MRRNLSFSSTVFLGGLLVTALTVALLSLANYLEVRRTLHDAGLSSVSDVVEDMMEMLRMKNEIIQEKVNSDLLLMDMVLGQLGPVAVDGARTVAVKAVNQLTQEVEDLAVPILTVGGRDIGGTSELVDKIQQAVGGTATIFQVLPGKLLRVSTNVRTHDGSRAIGTYIPSESPVYETVMRGQTYRGRAFVVNDWHLTAYEPLRDSRGEIVAVIYVGRKLLTPQLARAIDAHRVTESGAFAVYDSSGRLIWHPNTALIGRSIVEMGYDSRFLDPAGGFREYSQGSVRRLALVQYFTPWDWFVSLNVNKDELLHGVDSRLLTNALLVGSIILAVSAMLLALVIRRLTRPLGDLSAVARKIADGDLAARFAYEADDPIGQTARSLNAMVGVITRRTRELEAVNKELETFSYSVSHDLKAPLRSLQGFSRALLEEYSDQLPEQGRDYVSRLRAAARRMSELIDDLLALARVTRSELRRRELSLSSIALSVAEELKAANPTRAVHLAIEPYVTASGDPGLIRLLLENLLGNSWKFSSRVEHPTIEFGRIRTDGADVFFVRDNGAGFDMRYADKLFAPFQRLHSRTEFEGTGIGLATSARIVFRHGGHIWAESSPGRGAVFYFTLSSD